MRNQTGRGWARYRVIFYLATVLVLGFTTASIAQVPVLPTPTPTPQGPDPTLTPPPPSPTPKPSPRTTPGPVPSDVPTIPPTESEEPGKPPDDGPGTNPSDDPGELQDDELPEGLTELLEIPVLPRTRPRNTVRLVGLLEELTEYGIPLEEVLVEGMGRFPVAGLAFYSDDWMNPRYNPTPHLHEGLDIFADFGTPIRAPDRGVVTRLSNGPTGGIGVWMRGTDGTSYYFAHLLELAEGLHVGQRVQIGTVIGYVGDSGNAQGGAPHLHFEIHRPEAIPPKPSVDKWLDEAEEIAPKWVAAKKRQIEAGRDVLGGRASLGGASGTDPELEATMLLTLLDPVGGSVGMLPRIELAPRRRSIISERLLEEIALRRVDGYLFVPSSQSVSGD